MDLQNTNQIPTLPKFFKYFPMTRTIIDCTAFFFYTATVEGMRTFDLNQSSVTTFTVYYLINRASHESTLIAYTETAFLHFQAFVLHISISSNTGTYIYCITIRIHKTFLKAIPVYSHWIQCWSNWYIFFFKFNSNNNISQGKPLNSCAVSRSWNTQHKLGPLLSWVDPYRTVAIITPRAGSADKTR